MIKRFFAVTAIVSMMVLMLGSITAFCEEETVPKINMKLNTDGSSSMTFNVLIEDEEPESFVEYYSQALNPDGYDVSLSEDRTSMIVSRTFPAEDGYLVDLSLYNVGKLEFVVFRDFFTTRYGIKNSTFNAENEQPGNTYLILSVETPVGAANTNAVIRDNNGKVSTWKIISGSKNEIYLTFKTYNVVPVISTIFGLAIILLLAYLIVTNKRRNENSSLASPAVVFDEIENFNLENVQVEVLGETTEESEQLADEQSDEQLDETTEDKNDSE